MMNRLLSLLFFAVIGISPALANFAITPGSGTTVFAIDAANQGTSLCAASSTECPATVLIDKTGTPTAVNANGQASAGNSQPVVLPAVQVPADPCYLQKKSQFTLTSNATTSTQLIGAVALNTIYICSVHIKVNAATALSFLEGTGSNCATSQVALVGSTTAANGIPYSGIGDGSFGGNGIGTVWSTVAPGDALCFAQSVAEYAQITIAYVQTSL